MTGKTPSGSLLRMLPFLSKLRFPQLFALVAGLFVLNLFLPDPIPAVDELILGLLTLMLGSLKAPAAPEPEPKPPEKNVTPNGG